MRRLLSLVMAACLLLTAIPKDILAILPVHAQDTAADLTPEQKAWQVFNRMTPKEKVGQLFLVSFEGAQIDEQSKIFDLILNYHVGGVVLMAENNNFVGPNDTVSTAFDLIGDVQKVEWLSAHPEDLASIPSSYTPGNYIPLFVAISQEGDGSPNDQILNGLTPLPSQMAIGATWSVELSKQIGAILGSELSALGINMVFGPSLDVLDLDYSGGKEGLGTRSFGANAYWVGKLGQAYIEGLHTGSQGQLLVISKHFPGRGSADRDPNIEVATVRKPLDLLLQKDLNPFFAVTGSADSSLQVTDGLMTAHIRYEGLQGAIRNSTRPFGLDLSAIEQIFGTPGLQAWRQEGGILVSDNLGSEAVRRFYDPNSIAFDARQVARNAINAGIDLLYLDNFVATGDIDQYTTIIRTLEFFLQKYLEDETFAQRVDSSVLKVLEKKFTVYPEFDLQAILPPEVGLQALNTSSNITYEVAQKSITLLHPHTEEYASMLPNPPGLSDRTVFFTDLKMYQQCTRCPEIEMIPADALRKSVIRLYGPQAGGNVAQYLLSTFSFADLMNMLNGTDETRVVEEELRAANWVVFAFMETDASRPSSMAFKRLLAERPDLLANKNTIAFAFSSPHLLDATEISKLTAYYAVYSKIPAFTEIATRVLFQEIVPSGRLPISLPAVGYDLGLATSPDPSQYIPLLLDTPVSEGPVNILEAPTPAITSTPQQAPSFKTGDTLPLVTGVIYDRNRNPVPDGTSVSFIFTMEGETSFVQTIETTTKDGIARAEFLIQNEGRLLISVTSGAARNSNQLALNITEGKAAVVTVIVPTAAPTITPSPTPTQVTLTPTATSTPPVVPPEPRQTSGFDWILSMIVIWGFSAGVFMLGRMRVQVRWALRWGLLSAIGGMTAYTFLALKTPLNQHFLEPSGFWGIFIALLLGMGVGCLMGGLWYWSLLKRARRKISTNASSSGSG